MKINRVSRQSIVLMIIIFILGIGSGKLFFTPKVITKTVIEEKTTIDSSVNKIDTTFKEKAQIDLPIPVKETRSIIPGTDPETEKYDSIRTYSGTYSHQYGKLDWEVTTGGILESFEFKPQFEIPTVTVTKEKTITETRTIIQKGLFAGGGINSQGPFHIGVTYLGNKFLIEYNFTPQSGQSIPVNVHQIGFKYKIF